AAKKAVSVTHTPSRAIWDTEHNVGRKPANDGYKESAQGAWVVARTYVLAAQYHVARTFWYGADDRAWGGTWLEKSNYSSLTYAATGYKVVRSLLVNRSV